MSKKHSAGQARRPDRGDAVDEHGRPPGASSRTGTGDGPAADPDRVDRARGGAVLHGRRHEPEPVDRADDPP